MEGETQQDIQPVNLTVEDLKLLSNAIEVASSRGAYKASEFTHVGGVFDKLNGFINQVERENPKPTDTTE